MRPVRRDRSPLIAVEDSDGPADGGAPEVVDFEDYADAKADLVSRLGLFCSYCERAINTNLAVEHIQPKKGDFGRPDLAGRWENFLLACVNCNSTKGYFQSS
ncbi:MAG: HNH endonuclease [Acidobacteriota bacterium]